MPPKRTASPSPSALARMEHSARMEKARDIQVPGNSQPSHSVATRMDPTARRELATREAADGRGRLATSDRPPLRQSLSPPVAHAHSATPSPRSILKRPGSRSRSPNMRVTISDQPEVRLIPSRPNSSAGSRAPAADVREIPSHSPTRNAPGKMAQATNLDAEDLEFAAPSKSRPLNDTFSRIPSRSPVRNAPGKMAQANSFDAEDSEFAEPSRSRPLNDTFSRSSPFQDVTSAEAPCQGRSSYSPARPATPGLVGGPPGGVRAPTPAHTGMSQSQASSAAINGNDMPYNPGRGAQWWTEAHRQEEDRLNVSRFSSDLGLEPSADSVLPAKRAQSPKPTLQRATTRSQTPPASGRGWTSTADEDENQSLEDLRARAKGAKEFTSGGNIPPAVRRPFSEGRGERSSPGGPARKPPPKPQAKKVVRAQHAQSTDDDEFSREAEMLGQQILESFERFDTNKNGTIEREELAELLRVLNPRLFSAANNRVPPALHILFDTIDQDGSGKIDFTEFVTWVLGNDDPASLVDTLAL